MSGIMNNHFENLKTNAGMYYQPPDVEEIRSNEVFKMLRPNKDMNLNQFLKQSQKNVDKIKVVTKTERSKIANSLKSMPTSTAMQGFFKPPAKVTKVPVLNSSLLASKKHLETQSRNSVPANLNKKMVNRTI